MQLSVDTIKIDRVFTAEIPKETRAERIVTAIIAMAKALGMALTAEGIGPALESGTAAAEALTPAMPTERRSTVSAYRGSSTTACQARRMPSS